MILFTWFYFTWFWGTRWAQYPGVGEADLEGALGTAQAGFRQPAKTGLALQTGLLLPSPGKIPHGDFQTRGGVSAPVREILWGLFVLFKARFSPLGPCDLPKCNVCTLSAKANVRAKQFFQQKTATREAKKKNHPSKGIYPSSSSQLSCFIRP